MKRPISRVILSGVVGVAVVLALGGCSKGPCHKNDTCEALRDSDPNRTVKQGAISRSYDDSKYTKAEAAIAKEALDTGAELVYIWKRGMPKDPSFAILKRDEQATEAAHNTMSTKEEATLAREAQDTGAELEIKKINEQATETAVEAYTEEPRWDGASEYSQACSPSSGDLGCD